MCRSTTRLPFTALDRNTLIGEFLFGEGRAKSLDGAAADHTRYTEALGYRMSDQIGEVLLRDLDDAEMIFEFQHTVYLPD